MHRHDFFCSLVHYYYYYYYYYYFYSLLVFSHQCRLVVFLWSLSDIKSSQVSRTLLSILADVNNSVVWMVSFPPLISSSLSISLLLLWSTAFYNSLERFEYFSILSISFIFTLCSVETSKSTRRQVLFLFPFFFLLISSRSGLPAVIW